MAMCCRPNCQKGRNAAEQHAGHKLPGMQEHEDAGHRTPLQTLHVLFTQEGAPLEAEEVNAWANVTVMWGNLLYEASQMRAAVGHEWRPALDEAVAKFRAAGCPEADIRQALANHTQAAHIELPPLVTLL